MKPMSLDEFQNKTSILPAIVAKTVIAERGVDLSESKYAKDNRFSHEQVEAWFADHVEQRVVYLLNNNQRMRKMLNGTNGRDKLYMFVEHWFDAYLASPKNYRKDYSNIKELNVKCVVIDESVVKA